MNAWNTFKVHFSRIPRGKKTGRKVHSTLKKPSKENRAQFCLIGQNIVAVVNGPLGAANEVQMVCNWAYWKANKMYLKRGRRAWPYTLWNSRYKIDKSGLSVVTPYGQHG